MKIAILGYGKMGKEIEKIALSRGHEISGKISSKEKDQIVSVLARSDVAIEFSVPGSAIENMDACFASQVPVVIGTTGWNEAYDQQVAKCNEANSALLFASNFSLGVNLFFQLNKQLARLMHDHKVYTPGMTEIHHTEKLDSPSGTAITLAEGILEERKDMDHWINEEIAQEGALVIKSVREPGVPGTHEIYYGSQNDEIKITHTAFDRSGFALGAVLAAEFLADKQGIFTMSDVLENLK